MAVVKLPGRGGVSYSEDFPFRPNVTQFDEYGAWKANKTRTRHTIGGDHEESDIGLSGTRNHVLDEISVTGSINDGVVPLVSEELLGGARDSDTTSTLFLLAIHVESKGERRLSELVSLLAELLHLTLGDTAELEEQTSSGGGLAGIDVSAAENNRYLSSQKGKMESERGNG